VKKVVGGKTMEGILSRLHARVKFRFIKKHKVFAGLDSLIGLALVDNDLRSKIQEYIDSGYKKELKLYVRRVSINNEGKSPVITVEYHRRINMLKRVARKLGKRTRVVDTKTGEVLEFDTLTAAAEYVGGVGFCCNTSVRTNALVQERYRVSYIEPTPTQVTLPRPVTLYDKYGRFVSHHASVQSAWKKIGGKGSPSDHAYSSVDSKKGRVTMGHTIKSRAPKETENEDIAPCPRSCIIARYTREGVFDKLFIGKKEFMKQYTLSNLKSVKSYAANKRTHVLLGYKWKRLVVSTVPPRRFYFGEVYNKPTVKKEAIK
jgi:hypothetical protein